MAIQQVVPISLTLMGDGTSTTFKYVIAQLFAVNASENLKVVAFSNVPSGVSAASNLGHVVASLTNTNPKQVLLTFNTAPAAGIQGEVNVNLFYNSQ